MSKKDINEQETKETESEKNIENEIDKESKKEVELLVKIADLEKQLSQSLNKINKLESTILEKDSDYTNKIALKAEEAKKKIEEKIIEITNKNNEEIISFKKYGLANNIAKLIDVIDQFSSAVNYEVKDEKIKNYQMGFKMFLSLFYNWMNEMNVIEIPIKVGDKFNELYMEPYDVIEDKTKENDTVYLIRSKAYKLHDRIIKHATVVVVKNK